MKRILMIVLIFVSLLLVSCSSSAKNKEPMIKRLDNSFLEKIKFFENKDPDLLSDKIFTYRKNDLDYIIFYQKNIDPDKTTLKVLDDTIKVEAYSENVDEIIVYEIKFMRPDIKDTFFVVSIDGVDQVIDTVILH